MLLDRFRLDGKVALVTGAGRGIGEGIALAFAEVGARVICTARTQSEIDDTAQRIVEAGGEASAVPCDVRDEAQLDRLVATSLAKMGRIDVVVNNAGGGGHAPTLELEDEFVIDTLRLNLLAHFLGETSRHLTNVVKRDHIGIAVLRPLQQVGRAAAVGTNASQALLLSGHGRHLVIERRPAHIVDQAELAANRCQSLVGVVLA